MKKLLLITSMFLCFAGVVSASSLNGDYKGNPIVKVNINGNEVISDIPAQIIDGTTLLPLRSVSESLNAVVNWNSDTYSVDIKAKDQFIKTDEFKAINADMQAYRLFLTITDKLELTQMCVGLVSNSITQAQMMQAQQQVDRIDTDYIDGTVSILRYFNINEYNQFVSVAQSLKSAKNYLKNNDTKSANTQWMIAKTTLNTIYTTLDSRLFNEVAEINTRIVQSETSKK